MALPPFLQQLPSTLHPYRRYLPVSVLFLIAILLCPSPAASFDHILIVVLLFSGWMVLLHCLQSFFSREIRLFHYLFPLLIAVCELLNFRVFSQKETESAFRYALLTDVACIGIDLVICNLHRYPRLSRCLHTLFQLCLLVFPVAILGRNAIDRVPLDHEAIISLYQTDLAEALGYACEHAAVWAMAAALLAAAILIFMVNAKPSPRSPHRASLCAIVPAVALLAWITAQNKLHNIQLLKDSFMYFDELSEISETLAGRQNSGSLPPELQAKLLNSGHDARVFFILGESHARNYTTGYGYSQPSTPFIASLRQHPDVFFLDQAFSCNTSTIHAVEMIFTNHDQYENTALRPQEKITVFELLRQCGYATSFISNQYPYGKHESPVAAISTTADSTRWLNTPSDFILKQRHLDAELMEDYSQHTLDGPRTFTVFHLIGSHSPYKQRLPQKDYAKDLFADSYDRILHYVDSCLETFFKQMTNPPHLADIIIYMPDHGEDPVNYQHDQAHFPKCPDMVKIPMFIYLSPDYQKKHPAIPQALRNAQNRVFTNDLTFNLLLALLGIDHQFASPKLNLLSTEYNLDDNSARTLTGRYKLDGTLP